MNTHSHTIQRRQGGFSLVEIMIALLIGLFLLGGLLQVFDNSKRGYRYQEGLSHIQEQGRFAMEFLTVNLRMAGFPGSNPPTWVGTKIIGFDGVTDFFVSQHRSAADCRGGATATTDNTAVNLFRINQNNLECTGLANPAWEVFVQDIEDMQFLYGEDTDADGFVNRYVTATQGPDFDEVINVRVALLVRSADGMTRVPETYTDLAGNQIVPNDQRLRRTFVSTINLRN